MKAAWSAIYSMSLCFGAFSCLALPAAATDNSLSCRDGDNAIVFRLPGHGKAELISASDLLAADFSDLKERDWSLRIERAFIVIANSRGGRLQVFSHRPQAKPSASFS